MQKLTNFFYRLSLAKINYEPLIEVRVFRDALLHNLNEFRKRRPNWQFAPVLKSNAYGHGLVQVATVLDQQDKAFFVVDSFYEALLLRKNGIKSHILILGFNRLEQLLESPLKNCTAVIMDLSVLCQVVASLKKPTSFHLKIDTGMHRQGLWGAEIERAVGLIKSNPNFILEGLCTHFADADGENQEFTRLQISRWNETVRKFEGNFKSIKYFHAGNTAGVFYGNEIKANVGRLGIGLYGLNNSQFEKLNLKPALEMTSIITSLKTIPAGEKIGYNITYQTKRLTMAATIPVGFNEGFDKRLSCKGTCKLGEKFCSVMGKISMNITSLDVTDVPSVKVGDEVIVISKNSTDPNSVENIAKACMTSHYEILVHIPQYLRRTII